MGSSTPLAAALFVAACTPHAPSSVGAERGITEAAESSDLSPRAASIRTFSDRLIALDSRDPQVLLQGIDLWVRYHVVADADTRLTGLVRLRQIFVDVENLWQAELDMAPLEPAKIEALERGGLRFYDRDGDGVHVVPDLVERHADAWLRPQERRWLRAVAAEAR